jgi:hypothetical protein
MKDMNKINKEIAAFIVIIALVILWGLFTKAPIDTKMPVREQRAGGLLIEFEDGITESGVKAILENYNMTMNYSTDYNYTIMPNRYYIIVNKDKREYIKNELRKEENWTDPVFPDIKKGNYYIITVTKQATQDNNFLEVMEKNNLRVKKSIYCYIHFGDGSQHEISEKDAIRIKNELETNEKVLIANPDYST